MPRPVRTTVAILTGLFNCGRLPLLGWSGLAALGFIGRAARLVCPPVVVVLQRGL